MSPASRLCLIRRIAAFRGRALGQQKDAWMTMPGTREIAPAQTPGG